MKTIGAELISALTLGAGVLALGAATLMYLRGGDSAPLVGAIGLLLGKAGTVVDYWLGSSHGSKRKDAVIAEQLPSVPIELGKV